MNDDDPDSRNDWQAMQRRILQDMRRLAHNIPDTHIFRERTSGSVLGLKDDSTTRIVYEAKMHLEPTAGTVHIRMEHSFAVDAGGHTLEEWMETEANTKAWRASAPEWYEDE